MTGRFQPLSLLPELASGLKTDIVLSCPQEIDTLEDKAEITNQAVIAMCPTSCRQTDTLIHIQVGDEDLQEKVVL